MSIVAQTTERKAVTTLKKVLPYFERLDHVAMTAADALDTTTALNLIRRVIEATPNRNVNPKNKTLCPLPIFSPISQPSRSRAA